MKLEIVKYPNPVLQKFCTAIDPEARETRKLVRDMLDTLKASKTGIGLAAPQVGVTKRVFVVNMKDKLGEQVFINPEMHAMYGVPEESVEGCLSIPGVQVTVKRYPEVVIRAQNLKDELYIFHCTGLLARCVQHEYDHLQGLLTLDRRVTPLTEEQKTTLENLCAQYEEKK